MNRVWKNKTVCRKLQVKRKSGKEKKEKSFQCINRCWCWWWCEIVCRNKDLYIYTMFYVSIFLYLYRFNIILWKKHENRHRHFFMNLSHHISYIHIQFSVREFLFLLSLTHSLSYIHSVCCFCASGNILCSDVGWSEWCK